MNVFSVRPLIQTTALFFPLSPVLIHDLEKCVFLLCFYRKNVQIIR